MTFFEAENFKELINFCLPQLKQRGVFSRIAEHLNISNVYVSQVFRGDKHLSFEQALLLTDFFGFSPLQTQYFMHLIGKEKAGIIKLVDYHDRQLIRLRKESRKIAGRVKGDQSLSLEDQAMFYSDWKFTAAHLACGMPRVNSAQDLAQEMNLSVEEARDILNFLLEKELVVSEKNKLSLAVTHTHLPKGSPLVSNHHKNWRTFSMGRCSNIDDEEIAYTAPMVVSKALSAELHSSILDLIQNFVKRTEGCADEDLRVLNIDFLRVGQKP